MQVSHIHTCPECSHEFDLTITLGDPAFFSPEECPDCNHEIDQDDIDESKLSPDPDHYEEEA